MHIIKYNHFWFFNDVVLDPNEEYIIPDDSINRMRRECGQNHASCYPYNFEERRFNGLNDYNGKRILISHSHGFGDMLFITSAIRQIKKNWRDSEISVCCVEKFHDIFSKNKDVASILEVPCSKKIFDKFDAIADFEGMMVEELSLRQHPIHWMEKILNLKIEDKTTVLNICEEELGEALKRFPRKIGDIRIGIQWEASAECRTYDKDSMNELISILADIPNLEILIFCDPKSSEVKINKSFGDNVKNIHHPIKKTFREAAAIAKTCDLMIGPDSGIVHACGALNVPTIALFATIPSSLRVYYQSSIHPMQSKMSCSPCFHLPKETKFPYQEECFRTKKCEALASISPMEIVSKALEILINENKNKF